MVLDLLVSNATLPYGSSDMSLAMQDGRFDLGVDVVGGIPHFERTSKQGAASV